jgi:hypothetical protein
MASQNIRDGRTFWRPTAAWALAYLAVMAAVVGGVFYGRSRALAVYGSPAAQTDWNAWRADAKKMSEAPSVVARRAPKSAEPPAVVLMRDHFGICLGLAILLSTVLFGTFMIFLCGALATTTAGSTQHRRDRALPEPTRLR